MLNPKWLHNAVVYRPDGSILGVVFKVVGSNVVVRSHGVSYSMNAKALDDAHRIFRSDETVKKYI